MKMLIRSHYIVNIRTLIVLDLDSEGSWWDRYFFCFEWLDLAIGQNKRKTNK